MRLGRWIDIAWSDLTFWHNMNDEILMTFQERHWNGSQLDGRTLLLLGLGGGDDFQFSRFLSELTRFNGRIIVRVWKDELKILRRSFPSVEFVAREEKMPSFDVLHQLMSVGRFLGINSPDELPSCGAYLRHDPEKVAFWHARLAHLPGLKVGLCWQGSGGETDYRSAPLESFADVPGVSFVSLQKGSASAQPLNLPWIRDWTNELHDFDDTAALISALDLVISVDTSVAHLAGALGKPTWVLLNRVACWRWMLDRSDNPWYRSTMRLWRQQMAGDWDGILKDVREALAKAVHIHAREAALPWS